MSPISIISRLSTLQQEFTLVKIIIALLEAASPVNSLLLVEILLFRCVCMKGSTDTLSGKLVQREIFHHMLPTATASTAYLQKTRLGCPQLNSLMMPGRWSSRRRSKRKSVFVGAYPRTKVCSLTGRTSSPKVSSPGGGTFSQLATSPKFGIVAETATNRTAAMGVCKIG